jgi:uncharacterized protein YhaN
MVREKLRKIWHHIDGPLGGVLIVCSAAMVGYVVRGYEDGGIVATLVERIRLARVDERNQCIEQQRHTLANYQSYDKLRDAQVATLIEQNKQLYRLVEKGAAERSAQFRAATAAAQAATDAANRAATAAKSAEVTGQEVSKKLDNATQPTAVTPKPWAGGRIK